MAEHQPDVYFTWPTALSLFPAPLPPVLPPPVNERTFRSPFGIDKDLYNFALRPEIPVTFAAIYILTVFALNAYNRSRNNEPWWLSRQKWFGYFIVVHNVLLAAYSFATFAAMFRAAAHTLPEWNDEHWRASTADALCKIHGPRGLGDAATFNTTINIWEVKNTAIHMGYDGNPDPTDVGRLWNEGLAFWGWMFYVSKFYEVLDTLIILAKGKRSATLQTYHHAGAMLCMWAGIRFMSPPIWMFVFVNSGIHAMMYTYFTLSALGVKIPTYVKRTLTSLQIAQLVFGTSYAALHLFIQYDIPITSPYVVTSYVQQAVSSASSVATSITSAAAGFSSAVSEIIETPTALTASPTWAAYVKKLLLRAAGEEGVAERVGMHRQDPLVPIAPKMEEKIERFVEQQVERFETRYRSEWTRVNCIDTSGEAFAILLNLIYFSPLTGLFIRFFVRTYTARGKPRSPSEIAKAAVDAKHETEESVEKAGEKGEDKVREESQSQRYEQLRKDVKAMKDGTFRDRRVSERVQSFEGKVKNQLEKAKEEGKKFINGNGSGSGSPRRSSPTKRTSCKDESAVEDEPEKEKESGKEESGKPEQKSEPEGEDKEGPPFLFNKDGNVTKASGEGESEAPPPADPSAEDSKPPPPSESKEKQDENISDSAALRPGTGTTEEEPSAGEDARGEHKQEDSRPKTPQPEPGRLDPEDSDEMGKSGVNVGGYEDEAAKDREEKAGGNGEKADEDT